MINFKKYALAAALVIPSVFTVGMRNSDAAKIVIDKDLANAVNVRTEAVEGDNIIGLIDSIDESYEIIEDNGNWLKIDFNGKEAYVGSHWFHVLEETKVVANTNFRKEASLESEVIRVLEEGTKVEVVALAENGFVKVEIEDEEGYIYHDLLESFREANIAKQAKAAPTKTNTQTTTATQQVQTQTYQQAPAQQTYQGSSNWAKEWIAQRESNGSYTAYNPNGGYYGRYQLNPSLIPYGASPAQQEAAADAYVAQRYGSWERAQQFWAANGWY